jgi:signal transduction histidine kinase
VALAVLLVGLIGLVDYLTGRELAASVFYLLPVWYVTWRVGRWAGGSISVLSAVTWFMADLLGAPTYSHPLIPYWNALVQLGFYLVVTYAVAQLRDAMVMQEQLTAFVVHDLKAPLANVMMALDLVRRSAGGSLGDKDKRLLRIANEAGGQMSRLVTTLLDLSRLRHHSMPIEPQVVDVAQLMAKAANVMAPWAEDKAVTIAVETLPDGLTARGDPDLALRVLVNLLSNAIKYSPKETTVTLAAEEDGGGFVAMRITDQGPGIPKEWQERAFDMYAQVQAQRGQAAVGSGLGLTFARMAVEAQGGSIWLESDAHEGTTVTFTLPAEADAHRELAEAVASGQ